MKKVLLTLSFIFLLTSTCYSAEFYFLGMNSKWLKKADWWQIGVGAASSFIVHELGHLVVLEMTNSDYDFELFGFDYTSPTKSRARSVAMAGFAFQHGTTLILQSINKESDFVRGYTAMTGLESLSYPLRHPNGGDLNTFGRNGGNKDLSYIGLVGLSVHELLRIEW